MRLIIATATTLTTYLVVGHFLGLHVTAAASAAHALPQFATTLLALVSAIIGGYIARQPHFALVAMSIYAVFWAKSIHNVHIVVHRLGGERTYLELLSANALPIAVSLSGVCIGAVFGYYLSRVTLNTRAAA